MKKLPLQTGLQITHLLLPLLLFLACVSWVEIVGLDMALADSIFAWSGHAWGWRDQWLTATLIHQGGRKLVGGMVITLLVLLVGSYCVPRLRRYRAGLWYVLATCLLSALVVNLLKEATHFPCPWDLQRYGGALPYRGAYFRRDTEVACFPAGHASAGYAWLGLYYFARRYFPQWRRLVLVAVLLLGTVFGVAQQVRGAHFLSHDVWSLAICWVVATVTQLLWPGDTGTKPARQQSPSSDVKLPC